MHCCIVLFCSVLALWFVLLLVYLEQDKEKSIGELLDDPAKLRVDDTSVDCF